MTAARRGTPCATWDGATSCLVCEAADNFERSAAREVVKLPHELSGSLELAIMTA